MRLGKAPHFAVDDPTTGSRGRADPHPVRSRARRPGLELKTLEPADLGRVGHFLGLANDDHAPPGPLDTVGAVDLKRRGSRTQAITEPGTQRGAEDDRLRSFVEGEVDRTDQWWRAADGNAANAAAGRSEHLQTPVPPDLGELDHRLKVSLGFIPSPSAQVTSRLVHGFAHGMHREGPKGGVGFR
jgi:hypothetical protein